MKKEQIVIDRETSEYIERLHYDVQARQSIISYMIANDFNIKSENFAEYQKQFHECKLKYDTAKEELNKQYNLQNKWNLDFSTNTVTYEISE